MNAIELIRAKQKELSDAAAAAKREVEEREAREKAAFEATGIPEMFSQIKDIEVEHWRDNKACPLSEHVKWLSATALVLLNKAGNAGTSWSASESDKGALSYRVRSDIGSWSTRDPENVRENFIAYMAKFLPPLENTDG